MTDPQLTTLAKHSRNMATSHRARLAVLDTSLASDAAEADVLSREVALWLQIADEISAYLAGDLEDRTPGPDQIALELS